MRSQIITLFAVALLSSVLSGCGGPAATNSASTANTNNRMETKTPAPEQVRNNAPTLTPVYKTYCAAWEKKDEAALRKVYSADTIKYFEEQMKEDKQKSLLKHLESDFIVGGTCEVVNEEITGDKGLATIRSKAYPNGIAIEFVKENGDWKMTNKSPGSVTQTAANSNTAK